jgi:hypothetical protein
MDIEQRLSKLERQNRNQRVTLVLLAVALLMPLTELAAQEALPIAQAKGPFAWLNGGIGRGSLGLAAGLSFSYQTGRHLISIRTVGDSEFDIFGDREPSEDNWDVGVLYGRSAKKKYGFISISAGLGLAGGVRRGKFLYVTEPELFDIFDFDNPEIYEKLTLKT